MKRNRRLFYFVWTTLAISSATVCFAEKIALKKTVAQNLANATESIRDGDLKKHIMFLASDKLEGREAGTRGGHAAGVYIRNQLKKYNVKKAGEENSYFQLFDDGYRNILGYFPGSDPKLKNEYIVICAHYDHVGYGNSGNSRGPIGFIHNGADDNASGSAALLEIAEALSTLSKRPKRSILIAFWDAEELGLLGSLHWLEDPTVSLKKIKLAINMDMVGRMRKNEVEVYGTRTMKGTRKLISRENNVKPMRLKFDWDVKRNSDHYSFFQHGIPSVMFHTGLHDDYHRPSDDANKINYIGTMRLSRLVFHMAYSEANAKSFSKFRRQSKDESESERKRLFSKMPAPQSRLGIAWDSEKEKKGVFQITSVEAGSPALEAGFRNGDRIVAFNGKKIGEETDLKFLIQTAATDVSFQLKRSIEQKPRSVKLKLRGQPRRIGISWSEDNASPGVMVIRRVIADSPAANAGLKYRDRIYKIDGKPFASVEEFLRIVSQPKSRLKFTIERNGSLRDVMLTFPQLQ